MREILFKAKSVDNGEWIEGFYYFTENPKLQNHHIIDKQGNCYGVIPETVCEYTGLTDKNGKRIFENDLVCTQFIDPIFKSTFSENIDYEESHEVKFDNGCFYAEIKEKANLTLYAFKNKIEVIGNIFENPELLESEDK